MDMQNVLSVVGGSAGLLYLIYWLLSRRKKTVLRGQVVLITGASSGLGKACAHIFHKNGCSVILAGRNMTELKAVQTELKEMNTQSSGQTAILKVDLGDLSSLEKKGEEVQAIFGKLDILVNNAGISFRGNIDDTNISVHQQVMMVNYFGQIALTKAMLPLLKKSPGGHIVAVSSIQGLVGQAYRSAYAASKHAFQAYYDCLRAELWNTKIKVCVVSPGYIRTNLSKNAMCGDGSTYGAMDQNQASGMLPAEVASHIVNAVETHTPEVLPAPFTFRLVVMLRPIVPGLVFWIMNKPARKQAQQMHKKTS